MSRRSVPLVLALAIAAGCGGDVPGPPDHLVLVTVDTLRADRLGAYGHANAQTPHLDALAAESVRFERAYAHSSMTLPSIASLLTGLLPAEHQIYSNRGSLRRGVPTFVQALRTAGFRTAAFLGSYALRPNRRLDRGFEQYTKVFEDREKVRPQPENRAATLTDAAIDWLDRLPPDERFALWIHYQEPHGPYTPESFRPPTATGPTLPRSDDHSGRGAIPEYQWLGHGRLPEYLARYDGEVHDTDREVGRLLDALRARDLYERSLIVFTADHGEAFGEDGLYLAHGEGLHEALLRVPLLLRAPGVAPRVRGDRVRQIDVAPTALALLGVTRDGSRNGRLLLDEVGDRPLVAQLVLRDERWRSIRDEGLELVTGTDPEVLRSTGDAAEAPAGARAPLLAELDRLAPWPVRLSDLLSAEEAEALRAMGYAN